MVKKAHLNDQHFRDQYDGAKLRRFNDELRQLTGTINIVIDLLAQAEQSGGAFEHVLASTAGLGQSHAVADLEPGMVLMAIAANNAAFRAINLDDINDVDVSGANEGDVLRRIGARWEAATLPGISSLTDPGQDLIVYWNDDDNDLDYLLLGTGLVIAAGMLVIDTSAIDHGSLAGLGDDDHLQYAQHAEDEEISGDWTFTGNETVWDKNNISILFRDSSIADPRRNQWNLSITGDEFDLSVWDGSEESESLLNVTRYLGEIATAVLVETITTTKSGLEADHQFDGPIHIEGDDVGLTIGGAVSFAYTADDDRTDIRTSGDVIWENANPDVGGTLYLGFDVVEVQGETAALILRSSAEENEGGWGLLAEFGTLQIAALNDDGSVGEAWVTVHSVDGEIGDSSINFSGGALRFNGAEIVTEDSIVDILTELGLLP